MLHNYFFGIKNPGKTILPEIFIKILEKPLDTFSKINYIDLHEEINQSQNNPLLTGSQMVGTLHKKMIKGDIGKFLKAPNDHVEMKLIFSRYVGENLLQSVEAINGWYLVCYDNVNRKYGKYELTIQKGGKNGISFDFKGKKFDEETVIKVLVENGHNAKEFNNLNIYLAKWEQEKSNAEAEAKKKLEEKAKADAEAKARKEQESLWLKPPVGSVWRPLPKKDCWITTLEGVHRKLSQNETVTILDEKDPEDKTFIGNGKTIIKISTGEKCRVSLYSYHGYFLEDFEFLK